MKKQTSNTEHSTTPRRGFFSAVLILVTKILTNSSVSCKISFSSSGFNYWYTLNKFYPSLGFPFSHSKFDVGRSMFDVHLFQPLPGKNNLTLMGRARDALLAPPLLLSVLSLVFFRLDNSITQAFCDQFLLNLNLSTTGNWFVTEMYSKAANISRKVCSSNSKSSQPNNCSRLFNP
jgi:hypothetical protein